LKPGLPEHEASVLLPT